MEHIKMVELLTNHQVSAPQIAKDLNISERTGKRYRKRLREGNVERKARIKTVRTAANIERVVRLFKSIPNGSKRKVAKVLKEQGIQMSASTALLCAKDGKIRKKSVKRKAPLTPEHRRKRVKFANKHMTRHWKNVLFFDETGIELTPKPNSRNHGHWISEGETVPYTPRYKHATRINAVAGICWSGRTKLVLYSGTLTGAKYASILDDLFPEIKDAVFKRRRFWVMQDAVPLHFTADVRQVFKDHGVLYVPKKEWPPNSPDLNPIGHVWSILKDRVGQRSPKTKQDLCQFAFEEWEKIPQEFIQNCISTLITRLPLVVTARGGHTGK